MVQDLLTGTRAGIPGVSDSLPQYMQGLVGGEAAGDRAGHVAEVDSSSHRLSDWNLSSKTGAASPDRGQRDLGLPVCRWGQHWGGVILEDPPSLPPHSALPRADPQVPQWKSFPKHFQML